MDAETLWELGARPVSEERPAGQDARGDAKFEALQSEIDHLSSPTAAGGIDWKRVELLAGEILLGKSKDLLVASYLAIALLHTRGNRGLAMGLHMLAELLEHWWDELFPPVKRMRGRRNALQWWIDSLQSYMEDNVFEPFAPDELASMKNDLVAMDELLAARDGEGPSLLQLRSSLDRLPVRDSDDESPAKPAPEPESQPSPAEVEPREPPQRVAEQNPGSITASRAVPAEPLSAPSSPPKNAEDARALLRRTLADLASVVGPLLDADLTQPLPYRLNRIAAWADLDTPPPASNGVSRVPPPTQARDILHRLLATGEPGALLQFAESRLAAIPLWLDLNRLAANSLALLGHTAARLAVEGATLDLLARLPALPDLHFSDGSPFADGETRAWLGGLRPSSGAGEDDPLREMRRLAGAGDLSAAAAALNDVLAATRSLREALRARVAFVDILLAANKANWSWVAPLLAEVDARELDRWDPEVATEVLSLAFRAAGNAQAPGQELRQQLLARISALDCALALRLGL